MNLVQRKDELFDENFNCKTSDIDAIVEFCAELTKITGIQCCTKQGAMYEWLPKVFNSVVKYNEKARM